MQQYPFIDMHTHLFNSHYLPLDGIFRSWGVPGLISRPLAIILTSLTSSSDFSQPHDQEMFETFAKALRADDAILFDSICKRLAMRIAANMEKSLHPDSVKAEIYELKTALEEIVHQYDQDPLEEFSMSPLTDQLMSNTFTPDQIEAKEEFKMIRAALFWALQEMEIYAKGPYLEAHKELKPQFNPVELKQGDKNAFRIAWEVLRFIGTLLDSERQIYTALQADYSTDGNWEHPRPGAILNVMMDMEKAYRGLLLKDPKWEFREQIVRMAALTNENGGKIISFAAVSPHRENWESYMDAAVARGIIGFKFYPPMGFRPINIPDYEVPVDQNYFKEEDRPAPNSVQVNTRIKNILKKCHNEGLRLYAHCTPTGFEAFTGSGLNADPTYWTEAITKYELHDLWLCLAHGGGTRNIDWYGWAASDENWGKTFAARVVKACREHRNVYCDLGYLLELFDAKERAGVLSRLKSVLLKSDDDTDYPFNFHDKVMYGSDWHMMSMIGHAREYLNIFYGFFDDPELMGIAPGFFSENAKRYLGIVD